MATRTTAPPPKIVKEFPKGGREATYPWEEWMDGSIRELIRGVHFKGTIRSMRQTASKAGEARGMKVQSRSAKQGSTELLYLRFVKK